MYRRAKALFKASRNSLGSRELVKKLREEGIVIGRYRMRTVMRQLKLKVEQRIAYKVTTKRKHSDQVADNLLNQNFNRGGAERGMGWRYYLSQNSRRLDVFSGSDGFIFSPYCWLAHR